MPFCPNCRYEYNPGVSKCPDCDEYLVDTLPESDSENEEKSEDIKYVPLCRLTSKQYADMLVEALKSKGIHAIAYSGTGHFGFIGTMGTDSYVPVGGAYTVLVLEDQAEDAAHEAEVILGDRWPSVRLR
jgi:hypothetical protein